MGTPRLADRVSNGGHTQSSSTQAHEAAATMNVATATEEAAATMNVATATEEAAATMNVATAEEAAAVKGPSVGCLEGLLALEQSPARLLRRTDGSLSV